MYLECRILSDYLLLLTVETILIIGVGGSGVGLILVRILGHNFLLLVVVYIFAVGWILLYVVRDRWFKRRRHLYRCLARLYVYDVKRVMYYDVLWDIDKVLVFFWIWDISKMVRHREEFNELNRYLLLCDGRELRRLMEGGELIHDYGETAK